MKKPGEELLDSRDRASLKYWRQQREDAKVMLAMTVDMVRRLELKARSRLYRKEQREAQALADQPCNPEPMSQEEEDFHRRHGTIV